MGEGKGEEERTRDTRRDKGEGGRRRDRKRESRERGICCGKLNVA